MSSGVFQRIIITGSPVITDGGWGTQLIAKGLPAGTCPDSWNLTHCDEVQSVAASYVSAGSRIILTNTFGANRFILDRHQLANKTFDINWTGAAISKRAAGDRAKVFGSVGPTGRLPTAGQGTVKELQSIFSEQIEALKEGGADGVVIETMADPEEAQAAVAAAKSLRIPVVLSWCFDSGKEKDRTMTGLTVEKAAQLADDWGCDAVGCNCGVGIDQAIDLCQRFSQATGLPLWMKPNSTLPCSDTLSIAAFVEGGRLLHQAGATFIGGCCGTTPQVIAALNHAVRGTGTFRSVNPHATVAADAAKV